MFIKKRKITKASIDELAKRYPQEIISDEEARNIVGRTGGYTCRGSGCYSYEQYIAQAGSGMWMGGCVDMGNEHIYVLPQSPGGSDSGDKDDDIGYGGDVGVATIIGIPEGVPLSLRIKYYNWFMAGMSINPSGSWGWGDFVVNAVDGSGSIDGGSGGGSNTSDSSGRNVEFAAGEKCVFDSMQSVWYSIYGKNIPLSSLESQFAAKYRTNGSTVSPKFGEVNNFLRDNFTVSSYEASDSEANLSLLSVNDAVKKLNSTTNNTPNGSTPKMLIVIDQDPSSAFKLHMVEFDSIDSENRIRIIDKFKNESYCIEPEMVQGCYIVSKK